MLACERPRLGPAPAKPKSDWPLGGLPWPEWPEGERPVNPCKGTVEPDVEGREWEGIGDGPWL
jgi:hypothetical protein